MPTPSDRKVEKSSLTSTKAFRENFGWLLTLLLPVGLFFLSRGSSGLPLESREFLCIVSMAVCMWVFDLVPIFIPALLVLLTTILLDIAPRQVVLSGFTSDVFFMCLGIFVLAAVISSSGLMYRVTLWLLRWMPVSKYSSSLIIFFSGSFLTMFIPSPLGRSAILSPLIFELMEKTPGNQGKNANITPLLISGIHGTTLLSTIFLTGNPLNFVMLGFFDTQTQFRFQWLNWLQATVVPGIILVLGYLAVINWQIRKIDLKPLTRKQVGDLLSQAGPVTAKEWGGVISLISLCVGILTIRYHHVELVWLALGVAVILYLYDALSANEFRTLIDWPILIFIASIISWEATMDHLGLGRLISAHLAYIGEGLKINLHLGIALISLAIVLIRLVFPGAPTFIILMGTLISLAESSGISPWVLGFIALTISEGFVLPYQHGVYSQIMGELKSRSPVSFCSHKDILISNMILLGLRLVAIYATLFYWHRIAIV